MRFFKALLGAGLCAGTFFTVPSYAAGDGATKFNVFVPPNNVRNRDSYLIVTNVSPQASNVDIIDDDADGDSDDSVATTLSEGESYLVRLRDGAVNDDNGGIRDGDYFKIRASYPIVVQMATKSNWQHDWVPASGGGSRGTSFYVYSPASSGADADANVYAYEDNTRVVITDITTASTIATGKTSVNPQSGTEVLSTVLNQGEDLIYRSGRLGLDILDPGHTYRIQATKPVTVQYGHLGQVSGGNQARDGAGFVPSVDGSTTGSLYYFGIPHNPGRASEKELRISCFDPVTVSVFGASQSDTSWTLLTSESVAAGGHVDLTGQSHSGFRNSDLYRLTVDPPYHRCTVFEGNWLETGSFGTSDFASAVSSQGGTNLGHVFSAYVGPPGKQENIENPIGEQTNIWRANDGYHSHLYVYGRTDGTTVTVEDIDGEGEFFSHSFTLDSDGYHDVVIDRATYLAITRAGNRPYFEVRASDPVMVMNGNFNDNWMAYFHSVSAGRANASMTTAAAEIACNAATTVTVNCDLPLGASSSSLTATVTLPPGVNATSPGATQSGRTLMFPSSSLSAGESWTRSIDLTTTCSGASCEVTDLLSTTLECRTSVGENVESSLASLELPRQNVDGVRIQSFAAFDDPDYLAQRPQSHVDVQIEVTVPTATTVRLRRATNSPDPDQQGPVVATWSLDAGTHSLSHQDNYALHYERTFFYRLEVEEGDCLVQEGPLAVRTSSGMSSGVDSGLESNGGLSHQLARRAILRSRNSSAIEPALLPNLARLSGVERRFSPQSVDRLSQSIPLLGPDRSEPVNVTPADLPALTNAADVLSVDYLDEAGQQLASLLLVETAGELYEHSKSLCDRASGSVLDDLSVGTLPDGEFLEFTSRSEAESQGEYATVLKLYEVEDGYEAYAGWLQEHYPLPEEGQRVLNYQFWSARPGFAQTLAEDVLDKMGAPAPESVMLPPSYIQGAGTLSGTIDLDVAGPQTTVRRTLLLEDGTMETEEFEAADDSYKRSDRLFVDATIELIDDGQVLDRVWMSDGAWALMDDTMMGGGTRVDALSFDCDSSDTPEDGSIALSGCGKVSATVDGFAGVARHIGGRFAPLRLDQMGYLQLEVESNQPVAVCLHLSGDRPSVCRHLSEREASGTVVLPLEDFRDDDCGSMDAAGIELVSVLTHTEGALDLEVGALRFSDEGTASSRSQDCDPQIAASSGCGCRTDVGIGVRRTWPLLLMALGLAAVIRRRRLVG